MKKPIIIMAALLSVSITTLAHGAMPASPRAELGTVSVANQLTLGDIEQAFNDKMMKSGATAYRITSVSGNNRLHSTAVLYR